MKKILIVFILFISFFIHAETEKSSVAFSLSLNKSGTNMVSFTDYGEDQREKTRISLSVDSASPNPMHAEATDDFRISWSIYSPDYAGNSTADLTLTFESFTDDTAYMLRPVISSSAEVDRNANGLNYSVIIDNFFSSSEQSKPDNIEISSSGTALSAGQNQLHLISCKLNPYKGETGYADIRLSLNPPTSEGYSTGQYRGQIAMYLIVR